ncbi:MAG: FtsW/RodA/SpoVE family cell cycle protein [Tannerellaceae bacterium]|jgi:cell division protein FtsW|nr:FtsW/RodA/SpoVE family cell cycle protein [Tannerellaceae bacterium]
MELVNRIFKGDRSIWITFMLLAIVSTIEVFSASSVLAYKADNYWSFIIRHEQMIFIGMVAAVIIHHIPCRWLSIGALLLPISILLLVLTLVGGVEINGSYRWYRLFGISFQPSEVAKLACVIFMAFCLSKRKKFTEAQRFWFVILGVLPVVGLIMLENFSTGGIILVFMVLFMFIGQVSWKRMLSLTFVLMLLLALGVAVIFALPQKDLNDHAILAKIKHRLTMYVEPEPKQDVKSFVIDDDNRQTVYSKIAIANGGLGKFPGLGQQRETLPLAYADYIFAIIVEEMGVIGGIIVMILYIIILIRAGVIARKCEKLFPKYLVLGCSLLICMQAFLNMAVVVDLFPIAGQPLPLISRGGTSTVITCVYIGIILSVSRFGAGIGNEEDVEEEVEEGDDEVLEAEAGSSEDTPLAALKDK